ncbi:MAG: hypothetical protein K5981_06215 [Clostridia bacterium]|nr:hypothetical protein [Clostridia bacterium]
MISLGKSDGAEYDKIVKEMVEKEGLADLSPEELEKKLESGEYGAVKVLDKVNKIVEEKKAEAEGPDLDEEYDLDESLEKQGVNGPNEEEELDPLNTAVNYGHGPHL